jgi:hypothetical protein
MRLGLLLFALFLLTRCAGVSDYSPETGPRSSLQGNEGGAGVQASLWSTDPDKQTVLNQKPQSQ